MVWAAVAECDVFGDSHVVGHIPPGLIHHEDGAGGDVTGDLDQMLVHRMGVTRHDESSCFAVSGADCAEYVCRARALIVRGGWPRSTLRPASRDLVLLAYSGSVLIPDINRPASGGPGGDFCHCGGEVF